MTQGAARKWHKEIKRWAESPDGTKVWGKCSKDGKWYTHDNPPFWPICDYIVDDQWAELRKAQIDGRQLQMKNAKGDWYDARLGYDVLDYTSPESWRIKPEVEFPVYRRHKEKGCIAKFHSPDTYEIVISADKYGIAGITVNTTESYDREDIWEEVPTVTIDGGGVLRYPACMGMG